MKSGVYPSSAPLASHTTKWYSKETVNALRDSIKRGDVQDENGMVVFI
jgi:hypothetical protein